MNRDDYARLLQESLRCDAARAIAAKWKGKRLDKESASILALEMRCAVREYFRLKGDADLGERLAQFVAVAKTSGDEPERYAICASFEFTPWGETVCGEWHRLDDPSGIPEGP